MKKAIVLVSGGMDSAVVAHMAKRDGFDVAALTFDYGQRHDVEVLASKLVAASVGARHVIHKIDLRSIGGSCLTTDAPVPAGGTPGVPATYVPARNTIFLAFALAWAEVLNVQDLFIGVNAVDYSGYPDCRPEYIDAFRSVARLATKAAVEGHGVRVHAPLLQMTKAEIIRAGISLGVDLGRTISCYAATREVTSCNTCDACCLRKKAFYEAGAVDPAPNAWARRFGRQIRT